MMDWIKALSSVPKQAISEACDAYLRDQPRRRPTPAEIRQKAFGWMQTKGLVKSPRVEPYGALPAPERAPVDPARAQAILDAAGYTPKKFEAVQSRRMARTEAELFAEKDAARRAHWSETAAPDDPRWEALRRAREANPLIADIRAREAAEKGAAE